MDIIWIIYIVCSIYNTFSRVFQFIYLSMCILSHFYTPLTTQGQRGTTYTHNNTRKSTWQQHTPPIMSREGRRVNRAGCPPYYQTTKLNVLQSNAIGLPINTLYTNL